MVLTNSTTKISVPKNKSQQLIIRILKLVFFKMDLDFFTSLQFANCKHMLKNTLIS